MPGDYEVIWDDAAIAAIPTTTQVKAAMDRIAAGAVQTMKFLTPVSPVGPLHRSGNLRSSIHAFRHSGGLVSYPYRAANDIVVGPTASYARYVNDDTRPHLIESHGPWPLRNRETGQVFGRVVHHPGTTGKHFIEKTAESMDGRVYYA